MKLSKGALLARSYVRELNMSAKVIAYILGEETDTVSGWLNGSVNVTQTDLLKLAYLADNKNCITFE